MSSRASAADATSITGTRPERLLPGDNHFRGDAVDDRRFCVQGGREVSGPASATAIRPRPKRPGLRGGRTFSPSARY